jgi:hypothetical protein
MFPFQQLSCRSLEHAHECVRMAHWGSISRTSSSTYQLPTPPMFPLPMLRMMALPSKKENSVRSPPRPKRRSRSAPDITACVSDSAHTTIESLPLKPVQKLCLAGWPCPSLQISSELLTVAPRDPFHLCPYSYSGMLAVYVYLSTYCSLAH